MVNLISYFFMKKITPIEIYIHIFGIFYIYSQFLFTLNSFDKRLNQDLSSVYVEALFPFPLLLLQHLGMVLWIRILDSPIGETEGGGEQAISKQCVCVLHCPIHIIWPTQYICSQCVYVFFVCQLLAETFIKKIIIITFRKQHIC